jgi:predicted MFS family arabinose efflux permease
MIARIGKPEPEPGVQREGTIRQALGEGFAALLGHPLLRPIVLTSMGSGLFGGGVLAMFILYASRELGLSALMIGGVFALGGVDAVPGSMVAGWAGRRFGIGPSIVWGWVIEAAAWLLIPLAGGPLILVLGVLGFSRAVEGFSGAVANIHQWTLRQVIIPDHLHGRVTASHRFMVYGSGAIGALVGGALGSALDLRMAMVLCAIGALAARFTAVFSALRTYRG